MKPLKDYCGYCRMLRNKEYLTDGALQAFERGRVAKWNSGERCEGILRALMRANKDTADLITLDVIGGSEKIIVEVNHLPHATIYPEDAVRAIEETVKSLNNKRRK